MIKEKHNNYFMCKMCSYAVDEANEIEARLVESTGYSSVVKGYPFVDTNQMRFFSNDGVI